MATESRKAQYGVAGNDAIGGDIVQALALPPGTTLIQIRIGMNEPAEVICRYYPSKEAMQKVTAVLAKYELVLREETADTTPVMSPITHRHEE